MIDKQELFVALSNLEIDLVKLEDASNFKRFNIFNVLKIQSKELSHSNVLSWLLCPSESHGLGDVFLSQFIYDIKNKNTEFLAKISKDLSFSSFYTIRERDKMDIQVISDKEKIVIVIENKIWHSEGPDQLRNYRLLIEDRYRSYDKGYVYLSPNATLPENDLWQEYGYRSIMTILNQCLEKDVISSNEVRMFIQHYIQNLGRNIVEDLEIKKQVKELYRKHKTAIDLINNNLPDRNSLIEEIFRDYLSNKENVVIDQFSSNIFRFTTKKIDLIIPKLSNYWNYRLFLFEFTIQNNSIKIDSVITPSSSEEKGKLLTYISSIKDYKIFNRQENCLIEKNFNHINSYPIHTCSIEELFDEENFKVDLNNKLDIYFNDYIPKIEEVLSKYK